MNQNINNEINKTVDNTVAINKETLRKLMFNTTLLEAIDCLHTPAGHELKETENKRVSYSTGYFQPGELGKEVADEINYAAEQQGLSTLCPATSDNYSTPAVNYMSMILRLVRNRYKAINLKEVFKDL